MIFAVILDSFHVSIGFNQQKNIDSINGLRRGRAVLTKEKQARGRPRDEDKSRQIAEATWNLLSEHGYDALTFEAIASQVGCNRATIYRRHASKVELVASVLSDTLLSFTPIIDEKTKPREALHALVDIAVTYLSDGRPSAILHIASLAKRSPEVAEILDRHLASTEPYYIKQFKRIAPDADIEDLQFITHSLLGSVIYHLTFRPINLTSKQIDALVDRAIAMLPAGSSDRP